MSGRFLINRKKMRLCFIATAALVLSACSSGDGSSASSGMTVSGNLQQVVASGLGDPVSAFENNFSTTGTKISLDCGASGIFTASVDPNTGAFSAAGVPTSVPCSFTFVSSTNGATKCQVQFQDSNSYDLNNNPLSTGTATASSSVALGSISCDTNGNITIPSGGVAGISSGASVSANTAFDFTGTWSAAIFDGTLPTGYQTITNCTSNCKGPAVGDKISLVRFHGQKFTPGAGLCTPAFNATCATTDGTIDATKDGYGMSIWGGDFAHGIGACGANTGFTPAEARAFAHVNLDTPAPSLTGNQLSYAHFSWSTPTGFGGDTGWTKPWMYTGATSNYNMMNCQPVSVPSTSGASPKAGYACFSQVQNAGSGVANLFVWNVGLANAGGCVDSANTPLMINNWANLTGSCTNSASSFNSNFNTSTCSYNGAIVLGGPSISFTCSFTGGAFTDVSGATLSTSDNGPNFSAPYPFPMGDYPGQPTTIIASGASCGSVIAGHDETTLLTAAGGAPSAAQAKASKELMMRYQCYAGQYWQHRGNGAASTTCSRDYNFNWSTNNPANFVLGDDRSMKPQNAYITDRVFYSPDGQWAFLKNENTKFQSIPTPSGNTLCPMKNLTELKFQHISDSKIVINFTQRTVMADKSANCQGAVTAALAGGGTLSPDPTGLNYLYQDLQTQRMIFYLTK